jgi:hypothetical protein
MCSSLHYGALGPASPYWLGDFGSFCIETDHRRCQSRDFARLDLNAQVDARSGSFEANVATIRHVGARQTLTLPRSLSECSTSNSASTTLPPAPQRRFEKSGEFSERFCVSFCIDNRRSPARQIKGQSADWGTGKCFAVEAGRTRFRDYRSEGRTRHRLPAFTTVELATRGGELR